MSCVGAEPIDVFPFGIEYVLYPIVPVKKQNIRFHSEYRLTVDLCHVSLGPLCVHAKMILIAPKTVGDEVLVDLLHGKQQRLVHVPAGPGRQASVEQEQADPPHDRAVMLHGAVHAVFAPIVLQISRRRHLDERRFQVPEQLAVPLVSHHGLEFRDGAANEAVGGPVDAEFVVVHEKPCPVDQVLADLIPEQDAAPQVGQILLHPDVPPAEAAADQKSQVVEEKAYERIQHGKPAHRADGAVLETRRSVQAPRRAQHLQEDAPGLLVVGLPCSEEIDLGQDLHDGSAFGRDDSHVIGGVQVTASIELENRTESALLIVLIRPGEGPEVFQVACAEPVTGA